MEKELTTDVKNILGLQLPTDPRWVNLRNSTAGNFNRPCLL